ncbi:hypothetical protein N0V90_012867 [Kalmusia sp. IMI 367209]|nr:hypothetical protein N0V90_012867 [Kalmusia sp. IMI 367209]
MDVSPVQKGNSAYQDVTSVYTHIADPNERRRMALAEVDKAPFGWYHVRLAVVTGIGFFTDAYSLFAINLAVIMLDRVVMGIGVGGDYPLSAVITAEFASTRNRGGIIAAVFAMQGLGQLAASLMALIVVTAYKSDLVSVTNVASCSGTCVAAVDKMWRIIIAFGGVPGWFALYYRLTIPETPRYTFDVLYDVEKATVDARRYRYGKAGNTINPIEQAQVRHDMVGSLEA